MGGRNAFISRLCADKYEDARRIYSAWISIDFEIIRLAPARDGIGDKFSRIRGRMFNRALVSNPRRVIPIVIISCDTIHLLRVCALSCFMALYLDYRKILRNRFFVTILSIDGIRYALGFVKEKEKSLDVNN